MGEDVRRLRRGRLRGQDGFQLRLLGLSHGNHGPQCQTCDARQQVLVKIGELDFDLLQAVGGRLVTTLVACGEAGCLAPKLVDEELRMVFAQQVALQDRERGGLEWLLAYGDCVAAGAALLLAGAAVIVLAGDRVVGPAGVASDEARQQMLCALAAHRRGRRRRTLATHHLGLRRLELRVVDDPEIRHGDLDPFRPVT
nr:hypothetical protein [Sphingomonas gellani]